MSEKKTALRKQRLTDALVSKTDFAADGRDFIVWDIEVAGFGLRVHTGAKSYVFHHRVKHGPSAGKRLRTTLGTTGSVASVKAARQSALELHAKIAAGVDVDAEMRQSKQEAQSLVSLLLDRYEASLKRRRYVAHKAVMSLLRRRLAPFLNRDISDVSAQDLVGIIEVLDRRGEPGAQLFRSRVTTFLNWVTFEARTPEQSAVRVSARPKHPRRKGGEG